MPEYIWVVSKLMHNRIDRIRCLGKEGKLYRVLCGGQESVIEANCSSHSAHESVEAAKDHCRQLVLKGLQQAENEVKRWHRLRDAEIMVNPISEDKIELRL